MPDLTKINETIREIRKENRNEDKILTDLDFSFHSEKHQELKKTVAAFNNNYIQYESIGDKEKSFLPKDCLDVMRPYLSPMINNHKTQGDWKIHSGKTITDHKTQREWKIHLKTAISFISSKDFDETRTINTKCDNIEIMMCSETDEIIEELFESLFQRYQEGLEESMKVREFFSDSVDVLYYNVNKS